MTKRLLALAAALAMIGAALWIRERRDDDNDGGGGDGRDVVVACITELIDACQELDVQVIELSAAETLDALAAGDVEFDAWITLDPWPEIAEVATGRNVLGEPSGPIASTSLEIAAVARTLPACPDTTAWRCLADAELSAALPPKETALGLLLLGNAASGFLGTTDFFRDAFDDPEFDRWFRSLEKEEDALGRLVRELPAAFVDATGTTQADYSERVTGTRVADLLTLLTPDPHATVAVVVVPVAGRERDLDLDPLREAMAAIGWTTNPATATADLPDPGVLLALLQR